MYEGRKGLVLEQEKKFLGGVAWGFCLWIEGWVKARSSPFQKTRPGSEKAELKTALRCCPNVSL